MWYSYKKLDFNKKYNFIIGERKMNKEEKLLTICDVMCDMFIPQNEKETFKLCLYGGNYNVILQYLGNLRLKNMEDNGIDIKRVDEKSQESIESLENEYTEYTQTDDFIKQQKELYHYE